MAHYDVIVVGAGIEGSSIAYDLTKTGKKVLLLDQFSLPHTRGSSHGQSRIFRHSINDELWNKLSTDSLPIWKTLERESKEDLFVKCGYLSLYAEGSDTWQKQLVNIRAGVKEYEIISPEDFRSRYPMFKVKENFGAFLDVGGGILRANKAAEAFQGVFKTLGGTLKDKSPVTSIVPGREVKVETTDAIYTAQSVVIAAGSWSGRFASALGINDAPSLSRKAVVFYWKVADEEDPSLYHYSKMPCFSNCTNDDERYNYYCLPIFEYPGMVKICLDSSPPCDPDSRDQADYTWVEENICQVVKSTFPRLEDKPSITENCMITITPDWMPYIDRHPLHPNIMFAFGFSGSGFMIAPAVGRIVSGMVSGSKPSYSLERFRLDRFNFKPKM